MYARVFLMHHSQNHAVNDSYSCLSHSQRTYRRFLNFQKSERYLTTIRINRLKNVIGFKMIQLDLINGATYLLNIGFLDFKRKLLNILI